MKITRTEVEAFMRTAQKQLGAPGQSFGAYPQDLLHQAQVATEMLTGVPEWDVFLQRVQGFVDAEKKLVEGMTENLPPAMTSEQVLQAHRHIIHSRARIEAWEKVLSLPKEILAAKAGTQQTAA